jgi:hypothetical protein
MPILADVFRSDAFSAVELTRSISVVPNLYGRLNELNLFPSEPIPTTSVAVTYENGVLNLLPTKPRGAPATQGQTGRRQARVFAIPHIPHEDLVTAGDVQDRMAYGGAYAMDSVVEFVNRKLITMRNKHSITLEHLRMGALNGVVLDADGGTLVDFFAEFGVTQKSVNFALAVAATDVNAKIREVVRHIEDNLLGEVMTGVHCLCSPEFFDALIAHPEIKEAYKFYATVQNPLQRDVRRAFEHQGVTFEEYRGFATQLNADGTTTTRRFIAAGHARFFPVGTTETFATYFAPADIIGQENLPPSTEVYVAQALDPEFARWVKLHTQSNPLPVVKRPALLVRGTVA